MSNTNKLNILVFQGFYIPSFKAGGPVKTIKNMVDFLVDFQFLIITRDRDLGDSEPFYEIKTNNWQMVGNAIVLYLSSRLLSYKNLKRVIIKSNCDVIYLNSFFDYSFSIKPLILLKFLKVKRCPIVLAPRGEFSKGALSLKSFKKKLFIKIASSIGLHEQIIWQASSEMERQDIIECLSVSSCDIIVAKNLPSKLAFSDCTIDLIPSSELRIVFLSRITPKKNLRFAIEVLKFVKGEVLFDIYGPIENKDYWNFCLQLIKTLPSNIKVNYCGFIKPEEAAWTFSKYDLFFFPTLGENYGHVIAEAISVGTSVLISDQTPWRHLSDKEVGWDLSLTDFSKFIEVINFMQRMDLSEKLTFRSKVKSKGIKLVYSDGDIEANAKLFEFAIKSFKENNLDLC